MLVIIPTYKRLDSLYWVLYSLMNCDLPAIDKTPRLAIVNNFPPYARECEKVVENIKTIHQNSKQWEWILINRIESLLPINNWYSAINDLAIENEIVFLHGDDDLFIKSSIKNRYDAIINSDADILVSEYYGGLTFIREKCHLSSALQNSNSQFPISDSKTNWYSSPFISAVVLKKGDIFLASLALTNKWIEDQNWAPYAYTSLMIPFYLPLASKYLGGKIIYSKRQFVLRGTSLSDRINSPYGVPSWNSGFIDIFKYGILNNCALSNIIELAKYRRSTLEFINDWYLTFYLDKRIPSDLRRLTLKNIPFKMNYWQILKGIKKILAFKFRLTALSIRLDILFNKKVSMIEDLLNEI